MCECIFGWRSVPSHFWVTVALTSDLISKLGIKSGAYLLYSLRQESQIWCMDASLDGGMSCTILVTVTLTSDIVFIIIVSGASLLYHLG